MDRPLVYLSIAAFLPPHKRAQAGRAAACSLCLRTQAGHRNFERLVWSAQDDSEGIMTVAHPTADAKPDEARLWPAVTAATVNFTLHKTRTGYFKLDIVKPPCRGPQVHKPPSRGPAHVGPGCLMVLLRAHFRATCHKRISRQLSVFLCTSESPSSESSGSTWPPECSRPQSAPAPMRLAPRPLRPLAAPPGGPGPPF